MTTNFSISKAPANDTHEAILKAAIIAEYDLFEELQETKEQLIALAASNVKPPEGEYLGDGFAFYYSDVFFDERFIENVRSMSSWMYFNKVDEQVIVEAKQWMELIKSTNFSDRGAMFNRLNVFNQMERIADEAEFFNDFIDEYQA